MLRVITGELKGKRLKAPKGFKTRPTTDRVKESLFNIIGYIPKESLILDLFAGSGNIGIEFLSRGAKECYFIDEDPMSIRSIKENIKNTKIENKSFVYRNNVESAIKVLSTKGKKFDFIFLDPPYEKSLVMPTMDYIDKYEILNSEGMIIIEHETKLSLPENHNALIKMDYRKYGDTSITFYKREE